MFFKFTTALQCVKYKLFPIAFVTQNHEINIETQNHEINIETQNHKN